MEYDAIVLGSGPGGDAAAQQVVMRGGSACMIEHAQLGGTCVNVGCMPSKALLASSHLARDARRGEPFGLSVRLDGVDGPAVMRRAQRMVRTLRGSIREKVDAMDGLTRRTGWGRLIDTHTVEIARDGETQRVTGRAIVLATGARPTRPGFLPWDDHRVWTSDDALAAEDLPESIVVMGGGPLGCEFATLYAELGVPTTLIEMAERLLPAMDPEAGPIVADSLGDFGARVLTGRRIERVSGDADGLRIDLAGGETLQAGALLVAVGREAVLEDIGLEAVGIEPEDGIIPVDDHCRTSVEGIYAVGDAAEARNHAHLAMRMGIVAGDAIMGCDTRDDRRVCPVGVYTHPEVACVGDCVSGDDDETSQVIRGGYDSSGSAFIKGQQRGLVKVRVERGCGRILGATWIGPHAVDLIHELVLAMKHDLGLQEIYGTIHAHPGYQEMVHTLAERWLGGRNDWTCCEGPSSNINCPDS